MSFFKGLSAFNLSRPVAHATNVQRRVSVLTPRQEAQTHPMAKTPPHSPPSQPASPLAKRPKMTTENAADSNSTKELPHNDTATEQLNNTAALLSTQIPLQVKKLSEKGRAPTRGSVFAAGYDLYAAGNITIPGRGKAMVPTDISIAVPIGTCKLDQNTMQQTLKADFSYNTDGRVAPRSGLAAKHSIQTGAGVIDADYRGPVFVLLFNHSETDFEVNEGDRIAQLVLERIVNPDVVVVEELTSTERGVGGFGSTGGFGKSSNGF